jgi:hypothetical protein
MNKVLIRRSAQIIRSRGADESRVDKTNYSGKHGEGCDALRATNSSPSKPEDGFSVRSLQ